MISRWCVDPEYWSSIEIVLFLHPSLYRDRRDVTQPLNVFPSALVMFSLGCPRIRYKDDGATGKKIPVVADEPYQTKAEAEEDDNEDNENGGAPPPPRIRKRRLLRKDGGGKLADPVLSTLSVNKNLG